MGKHVHMPANKKIKARDLNGPMGRGRVVVFFVETLIFLPADFIRSKIRGFVLERALGHENANQDHHYACFFLLNSSMSMVCSNFP